MDLHKLFNLDALENQVMSPDPEYPSDWRAQLPGVLREASYTDCTHIEIHITPQVALALAYDIEELIMLRALFMPRGDSDA